MNDILQFLTSKEIIIVYIISALTLFICIVVYLIEKNNDNIRKKHNTKELNKLVEEVRAQLPEVTEEKEEIYDVPILETIEVKEESSINDLIANEPVIIETIENDEPIVKEELPEVEALEKEEDEFEYTTIEPDQETARLELRQLEEELERQDALEREQDDNNIRLTSFEEEQERTAIISMDELLAKSKELYEANELKDEGNEPISIQELVKENDKEVASYDEPFIIANVVPTEELESTEEVQPIEEVHETMHMDDFLSIKEQNPVVQPVSIQPMIAEPEPVEVKPKEEVRKFKSSPIISPIFGIEKDVAKENEMALENTANYEKLDAEIRRTNEFVMSLKELQGKLD